MKKKQLKLVAVLWLPASLFNELDRLARTVPKVKRSSLEKQIEELAIKTRGTPSMEGLESDWKQIAALSVSSLTNTWERGGSSFC